MDPVKTANSKRSDYGDNNSSIRFLLDEINQSQLTDYPKGRKVSMHFFFETKENRKPFKSIQLVLSVAAILLIILLILNAFDVFLLKVLLLVFGIDALTEGVKGFIDERKKHSTLHF